MKPLIISLALIAAQSCLGQAWFSGHSPPAGGGGGGGGGLIVSENFEGGGNPGWTLALSGSGAISFTSTTSPAPLEGSQSMYCNNTGGDAVAWTNFAVQAEVWCGFKFNKTFASGDNAFPIRLQDSLGANICYLRFFQGPAQASLISNGNTVQTANNMTDSVTYFCWLHYNASTGACDFEFETTNTRVGSGGNFCAQTVGAFTSVSRFFVGPASAGSASDFVFDELRISTTGYPAL